jgi:histidinol-phosphate aminotransferase
MSPAEILRPRQAIRDMLPYRPPTAGRDGSLRLDFNENTVGCSPCVLDALRAALDGPTLTMYPEYGKAIRELARFFGVLPDEILLTNGTDEAIQVLVHGYVEARDEVILPRPSYAMYRFYAESVGAAVREVDHRPPDLAFPLEEMLRVTGNSTRAVMIANPNNPTGAGVDLDGIERLLQAASQAAVLIDEAYFEFSGVTALPLLSRYPNLFVSRTFSKAYGLAALRIGCLFSQAGNIACLRKAQSPYSVNALAAVAARAAAGDPGYVRRYVEDVIAARKLLCRGLRNLGIRYYPSRANFVLIDVGPRAAELCCRLKGHGVLVRDRTHELPGCLRITVGTAEQVERLLGLFEELL